MAKYKAYPEYKDSGVEWLGKIPDNWYITKLKFVANLLTSKSSNEDELFVGLENISSGDGKYLAKDSTLAEGISISFKNNDVLFGKLRPYLAKSWLATFSGVCSSEFLVLRTERLHPRFLNYYLLTKEFIDQVDSSTYGSKMPRASWEFISLLPVPTCSYFLSDKIAAFLDHETAKIDNLIEKQQQLIELLKEKRQAVISHAVTKGLNPDVPMKYSGVEWLGEVPEHWKVSVIKYVLTSQNSRRIPLSSEERDKRSGKYRYYGASGVIDYIDNYIFNESTVLVGEDGANLVTRNTPLAFSATGKYWVNNHAHILKPSDGLVDYWAEAIEHIDINPIVSGSAQPKLTSEALNNLKIVYSPVMEERQQIENYIKTKKKKYNNLISIAKELVTLLQERRTALISAAVTGKIDVRDWVAPNACEAEVSQEATA